MYNLKYITKSFKQHLIYFLRRYNVLSGNKDYQKFIIVSRSRTGSTLLINYLDCHNNIVCKGELFQYLYKPIHQQWDTVWQPESLTTEAMGFKFFYNHPLNGSHYDILKLIKGEENIKIIHLIRKNLLEIAASQILAEQTGEYSRGANSDIYKTVEIPIESCLRTFNYTESGIEFTRKYFQDTSYLELYYEDLASKPIVTLEKIFNFLQIKSQPVKAKIKKQNYLPMNKKISNYEDLKKYFRETPYSKYFND